MPCDTASHGPDFWVFLCRCFCIPSGLDALELAQLDSSLSPRVVLHLSIKLCPLSNLVSFSLLSHRSAILVLGSEPLSFLSLLCCRALFMPSSVWLLLLVSLFLISSDLSAFDSRSSCFHCPSYLLCSFAQRPELLFARLFALLSPSSPGDSSLYAFRRPLAMPFSVVLFHAIFPGLRPYA